MKFAPRKPIIANRHTHRSPLLRHKMKFRPDIEGLRGIAVLAVVLFHLKIGIAPGGFTGVDIFFVISGYLITGILCREAAEDGRVHFARFWARRARRILPAATTVLLASVAFILVALTSPFDLYRQAGDIGAAALFVVNWRLAGQAVDYLAANDLPSIVLHYWSLAIEEQFYVFWPLAVWIAIRAVRATKRVPLLRALTVLSAILWVASFALSVHLVDSSVPYAFFASTSRAWQLLTGALAAFAVAGGKAIPTRLSAWLGPAGLAAIIAGIAAYSSDTPYPGWAALLPTLGSAAVIIGGAGAVATPAGRALSAAPLRFLGRVSYSWYLWHWPIAWLAERLNLLNSRPDRLECLAVTLLAGAASYYLIENPARFNPRLTRSSLISLGVGGCLVSLSFCAILLVRHAQDLTNLNAVLHDGRVISLQPRFARIVADGCQIKTGDTGQPPCIYGDANARSTVVLFGDSHAGHYFPGLEAAAVKLGWRLVVRVKNGCAPADVTLWNQVLKRPFSECSEWRSKAIKDIVDTGPRLVIVGGSSDYTLAAANGDPVRDAIETKAGFAAGERRMAAALLKSAASVVVLRDTPTLPEWPIVCLSRHPRDDDSCVWQAEPLLPKSRFPVALDGTDPRVKIVDMTGAVCPHDTCSAVRDGVLTMNDLSHLSEPAARALAPRFEDLLKAAAATAP